MTLRRRLALAFVLLAALLLTITAVSTALIRKQLYERLEEPLRREPFTNGRGPLLSVMGGAIDPCTVMSLDENSLIVFGTPAGKQLQPCRDQTVLPVDFISLKLVPDQASPIFTAKTATGKSYRTRVFRAPAGMYVGFGLSLRPTENALRTIFLIQLAAIAVTLGGLALLSLFAARTGLRSLSRISSTAAAISSGKRDTRITTTVADPPEVRSVGHALNEMLDESDRSFAAVTSALSERERSEDRLRQFVSDASHELKTPLTSIQGYSELLVTRVVTEPDAVVDTSRRINSEATRMARLVQDMLQLSRLDAEPELRLGPVNVAEIVRAAVADALAASPDWPIAIDVPSNVDVEADSDAMHQVVANLLSNIRQHTPAGTSTNVSVSTGGAACSIRIADTGPGIPDAIRTTVFERFVRSDASRSRQTGGAGLGLSIVKSLVVAHNGTITASANTPTGTVITITLPRTQPTKH